MSRVEKHNDRFAIAFGVDHVTSSYVQVWRQPMDKQEQPLIVIDNQGTRYSRLAAERMMPPGLVDRAAGFLRSVEHRFARARARGVPYPNLDAETAAALFELFGFPDMLREVREAFD
ncbi:MAG TPA: hypothetical protein VGI39_04855 [Polyangiaceae bacterium]|jgi:hypothetical protein